MNDLAGALARESKAAEAEQVYRKVVELKRRALGEEHPSTPSSMNGLGVLYRNQGKYPEAETWLRAALDGRRRAMGATHHDMASGMLAGRTNPAILPPAVAGTLPTKLLSPATLPHLDDDR